MTTTATVTGGLDMRLAQLILRSLAMYDGAVDGVDGPLTRAAVDYFQRAVGHLEVTGEIDPDTWGALLAAGDSQYHAAVTHDGDPHTWDPLPPVVVEDAMRFARACVKAGCVYTPGRGEAQESERRFVMTPGPFGVGRKAPATSIMGHRAGWVCSTYTYALAMYVCRHLDEYEECKAGGQPPIWDVLTRDVRRHAGGRFGPYLGLGAYFRPLTTNGATRTRHRRAHVERDCDLRELWYRFKARRDDVPEVMLGAWASASRGFYHHTMAVTFDRRKGEMWVSHAPGWRGRGGVFSGSPFSLQVVTQDRDADALAMRGWGRWYGMVPSERLSVQLARPQWELAVETARGVVQPIQGV